MEHKKKHCLKLHMFVPIPPPNVKIELELLPFKSVTPKNNVHISKYFSSIPPPLNKMLQLN